MFLSDFHTRDNGAGLIGLVVIPLPRTLNKVGTAQTPVSCCGPFSSAVHPRYPGPRCPHASATASLPWAHTPFSTWEGGPGGEAGVHGL